MRVLLLGALGEVGRTLSDALRLQGHEVLPVTSRSGVAGALSLREAAELLTCGAVDAVVNSAGPGDRRVEREPSADSTHELAASIVRSGAPAVLISTLRVLEGSPDGSGESDLPCPTTPYGEANARHERAWLGSCGPAAAVLRVANYFCTPGSRAGPQMGLLPWSLLDEAMVRGTITVRSSPATKRTFVDASDVARAVEALVSGPSGQVTAATLPGLTVTLKDLATTVTSAFRASGFPEPSTSFGMGAPLQPPTVHASWLVDRGWQGALTLAAMEASIQAWLAAVCPIERGSLRQ